MSDNHQLEKLWQFVLPIASGVQSPYSRRIFFILGSVM
jgi:hypothetical protein